MVKRPKVLLIWLRKVSTGRTRPLALLKYFWKTRYSSVVFPFIHMRLIFWTKPGTKNAIGSKFSDLAKIIAKVEDYTRIGVCLDTCKPISLFCNLKTCIELLSKGYAFAAVCEPEVDFVIPSINSLTYRVTILGRWMAGCTFFSALLMDRLLIHGFLQCDVFGPSLNLTQ